MENQFKIAVIDDDKIYLNLITKKIDRLEIADKIEVRAYKSGFDFLSDDFTPNVLVLDYHLNGDKYQNGLQVMNQVRRTMKKTMVYMISGDKDENIVVDVLQSGAMDFISKDASLLTKLVDHVKMEYNVFLQDLSNFRSREVQSKLVWGVAIFGLAPLVLQMMKSDLVPIYVALSLVSFVGFVVRHHIISIE